MKKGDWVTYNIKINHKYGQRVHKVLDVKDDKILINDVWVDKSKYVKFN